MKETFRTCNLCKQVDGNIIKGRRVKIGEYNVCNVCLEELKHLEEVYAEDFEGRIGQKVLKVIPWPAFSVFSWPQYSDVIVSGWEFHKREFGMAITENLLVAGRRSIRSYEISVLNNINKLNERLENTEDYQERMNIRRELHRWHKKLESIEKLARMGERRLPMIPLEFIHEMNTEIAPEWIKVKLKYRNYTKTFLGKDKVVIKNDFFTFSRIYEDALEILEQKVREKGGKVSRREVAKL